MMDQVTAPSKGNALRASWGAAVSSALGDLLPMGAANGLVRGGATGCGFQPLPQNLRSVETFDFDGPFALYAVYGEDGKVSSWNLRNCIWNLGGVTHESADDAKVEDEIDTTGAGGYVYVQFPLGDTEKSDNVTAHFAATIDALRDEQLKEKQYCVPLYRFKLTKSDAAQGEESQPSLEIIDLRTMPQIQVFEVGLTDDDEKSSSEGSSSEGTSS